MTLRCSLLGHRFEEATVERERAERGEEVVTVSREVEVCSRCDAERVISENTEITTVESPEDEESEPIGGRDDGLGGVAGGTGDDRFDPPGDPAEEDAEILTDEDDGERQPGEWPDEPAGTSDESAEPPSVAEVTTESSTPDRETSEFEDSAADAETFACPECGFSTSIEGSSLRRGDACPECMDGYLETR